MYGIHFDTGKATIQTDSETILGEIVKLLQQNPDLELRVESHTDNQARQRGRESGALRAARRPF